MRFMTKIFLFENDGLDRKKLEVYWDEKASGFRCRRDTYTCPIRPSDNIAVTKCQIAVESDKSAALCKRSRWHFLHFAVRTQ